MDLPVVRGVQCDLQLVISMLEPDHLVVVASLVDIQLVLETLWGIN